MKRWTFPRLKGGLSRVPQLRKVLWDLRYAKIGVFSNRQTRSRASCRLASYAFDVTNVYDNVQASLDHCGGLDISGGSRVLSVNGNIDPWSVLGLKKSPKYSLPVQLVDGASHHFWTHPVRSTDAVEIVQIREYIDAVVMEWLEVEERSSSSGSGSGSSGISGGSSSSLRAGRLVWGGQILVSFGRVTFAIGF